MRMKFMSLVALLLLASMGSRAALPAQDIEARWRVQHEAGLGAFEQGRYEEAARSFRAAIREAEDLGPENYRLAESLGALAETSRLLGDREESETLSLRTLGILERILHPQDPIIAIHRNNLAETYFQLGRSEEAERHYRQSLPILESALGPGHPDVLRSTSRLAAIADARNDHEEAAELYERRLSGRWGGRAQSPALAVLDSLAALLVIAHFPDRDRDEAVRKFLETLFQVRPAPVLYIASSRMLLRQQLVDAAEEVMLQAVREFPDSRSVRTELAELYAENKRLLSALEAFEQAIRLDGGSSAAPDVDNRERRLLHVRIGHMHIELGQFDEAAAAFQRALEIAPDAMEARLELAGQYLIRDMVDEAQAEYRLVVAASPGTADAHYGLSELYLRLDRFGDAAEAAAKALEIDPEHQRARYTRVRALARAGRDEEGRRELAEYQRREAIDKAVADKEVRESAINRSGAAALVDGRPEEAIELFRAGIEAQPDAAMIYLNLGVALAKLDRREAAIETFQTMLDLGCCPSGDSYLVHRNLYTEYEALGDTRSSIRHRARYLREYDRALNAALNRQ